MSAPAARRLLCLVQLALCGAPSLASAQESVAYCISASPPPARMAQCRAHEGCDIVLKLLKCRQQRVFLDTLNARLGVIPQLTNNDVFEIVETFWPAYPAVSAIVAPVQRMVREALTRDLQPLRFDATGGKHVYYEGGLAGRKEEGIGVEIVSDGMLERGQYLGGNRSGLVEVINVGRPTLAVGSFTPRGIMGAGVTRDSAGIVMSGNFIESTFTGVFSVTYPDGTSERRLYAPDGKLITTGKRVGPGEVPPEPLSPAAAAMQHEQTLRAGCQVQFKDLSEYYKQSGRPNAADTANTWFAMYATLSDSTVRARREKVRTAVTDGTGGAPALMRFYECLGDKRLEISK